MSKLQIRADEIRLITKTVGRFTSANSAKPQSAGVLLDASAEGVFAIATDGHRCGKLTLHPVTEDGTGPSEYNFLHILPPEALAWCRSLKVTRANAWLPVTVEFTGGRVFFTFFEISASFALLEGSFHEWRRIMAKPEGSRIVFNADYLKDACEAIKSHSALKYPGLEISFDSASGPARIEGKKEGLEIILMPMRLWVKEK